MILSMTGCGTAAIEEPDLSLSVEIRSVNNRYLKTNYKMPDYLAQLESDLERVLRRGVSRGAVTVTVRCKRLGPAATPPISEDAVAGYVDTLRQLAVKFDLDENLSVSDLVALPGVFDEEGTTGDIEPIRERLVETARRALEDFKAMRTQEGKTIEADLRAHATEIREHLDAINDLAPTVVEQYRDRLTARVEQLLANQPVNLAEDTLVTEVSMFAERSDISEEVSRLASHLNQFDDLLDATEPAGRKLEFVSQEMLREANTIGSKAGHAEISRRTVEVKAAIDRIKEQVQNAE